MSTLLMMSSEVTTHEFRQGIAKFELGIISPSEFSQSSLGT